MNGRTSCKLVVVRSRLVHGEGALADLRCPKQAIGICATSIDEAAQRRGYQAGVDRGAHKLGQQYVERPFQVLKLHELATSGRGCREKGTREARLTTRGHGRS